MGRILSPLCVKLIVGLISKEARLFPEIQDLLVQRFGPVDLRSPVLDFDQTRYYEKEMGKDLKRIFLSFGKIIPPERLVHIKRTTNGIEGRTARGSSLRIVNIDPGYITLSKLVLATTKNSAHRIYVKSGIFEEITLVFRDTTFQPAPWTYPDYRSRCYIDFFNEVRKKYYQQAEKAYGASQLYRCV